MAMYTEYSSVQTPRPMAADEFKLVLIVREPGKNVPNDKTKL